LYTANTRASETFVLAGIYLGRNVGASDNPCDGFPNQLEHMRPDGGSSAPGSMHQISRLEACKKFSCGNDSPDIPFNASLNGFSGCEHGCSYCFSQTTNEISPSLRTHLHRRNEQ
jgi:hypothetical protein